MRKLLILLTLLTGAAKLHAQQDAQQSQYMFNGIYINPAYAGYKENINLHAYYRAQWTGINGGPRSTAVAIDAIANDGNVGVAFQILSDKLGAQNNLGAYASYAYRLKLNDDGSSRLALGMGIGAMQLGINGALLDPNDPEPNLPPGTQSKIVPDGRVGVFYSNSKYFAGLSADNLISQFINVKNVTYLAQPSPHYYLTAGMLLPLTEDLLLKPSFLIKDDHGGPTSLDLNAFLILGQRLWVGGAYRTGIKLYSKNNLQSDLSQLNSGVLAVEVFPMDNLRIGYGYDFSVGPLKGYSAGTQEISIGYYFKTKKSRMYTPRYF